MTRTAGGKSEERNFNDYCDKLVGTGPVEDALRLAAKDCPNDLVDRRVISVLPMSAELLNVVVESLLRSTAVPG